MKEENAKFLKELLCNLSKEIPYKWRIQSFSKFNPEASVVAYVDARDVQDLLDEYCTYGWTRKHYTVGSNVYCTIGVIMPDGSIIERSDCGVESNVDKEKGEASDSFKRAAVNFKVGRFLYGLKIHKITTNEKKEGSNYPYPVDENKKRIYDISSYMNIKQCQTMDSLMEIWTGNPDLQNKADFKSYVTQRKAELSK